MSEVVPELKQDRKRIAKALADLRPNAKVG